MKYCQMTSRSPPSQTEFGLFGIMPAAGKFDWLRENEVIAFREQQKDLIENAAKGFKKILGTYYEKTEKEKMLLMYLHDVFLLSIIIIKRTLHVNSKI